MRRWIVPCIALSFAVALIVGRLSTPTTASIPAELRGAEPAGATHPVAAAAPFAKLASLSITAAGVTCKGPFRTTAPQVILVVADGTSATLIGCTRRDGGAYSRTLGPFSARIGAAGLAAPGAKREGDDRTPSGTFPMGSGFGTARSPGLRQGWLQVGSRDVWVDDVRSGYYNSHQVLPAHGRWRTAERLKIPAYRYAQVIKFNTRRTPGRGSAIFMHVGTRPTAGCVALATADLLRVMRWEHIGTVMVIA